MASRGRNLPSGTSPKITDSRTKAPRRPESGIRHILRQTRCIWYHIWECLNTVLKFLIISRLSIFRGKHRTGRNPEKMT